jgi:integrase/recombinase XerD
MLERGESFSSAYSLEIRQVPGLHRFEKKGNRYPMQFSKAIEGFLLDAPNTYSPAYIPTMKIQLGYMCKWFGDPEIHSLTPDHWKKYLIHLRTDYKPRRFNGDTSPLALATVDNHWKTIRGFYNWATNILSIRRPDLELPRPKYQSPQIHPLGQDEIKKLIAGAEYTQVVKQSGRAYKIRRPNADRDKAIILILLDTGVRLGEFYRLHIGDVNLENGEIYIRPYRSGVKSAPRTVYIGQRAKQAVWKYIAKQQATPNQEQKLFDLQAASIRLVISRIGKNAKVSHVHPHRFRHTFAVEYLRNGGDVFTLQRLMGHKTLAMTLRYVEFVKSDLENAHRRASPVDNWKL